MKFLRDLFMNVGNANWDLGRIVGAIGIAMMLGGQAWNIALGLPIELGPTGLGGGLAAVLGGAAALIYAKDRAKSETAIAKAIEHCPPEPTKPRARGRK
jgi:hypothetical protein